MAHANIYQVSLFPIPAHDRLNEEMLFCTNDWFIGEIADYVYDVDPAHYLQNLSLIAKGIRIQEDTHGKFILVTSKEDFFRSSWEYFCKKMESTISLEKFMTYRGEDDKFGDYIYADGEMMPFSRFVCSCLLNEPYYIGGVMGYHQ